MRRLVLILLVILTAAPQALAGAWFRCRTMGETKATCCCEDRATESGGPERPGLRGSPCCDILRNEAVAESASVESRGDLRASIAPLAAVPAACPAAPSTASRRTMPSSLLAAAPPGGQPIYLALSSLLL